MEQITILPRVSLGCLPTPLIETRNLTAVLGGPRILMKRDDLSGLALGGNKCRRFEFLMGYAKKKGVDSFVVSGVTNLSIQLVAAANRLGFKVIQVLHGDLTSQDNQGNYLLHKILGSDTVIAESVDITEVRDDIKAKKDSALEREACRLRKEGFTPFILRTFESTPIENVGWVDAIDEICQQLKEQNTEAQYLVVTTGQGSTHAGLALGAKYLRTTYKVIGISCMHNRAMAVGEVTRMANETAEFLELGISVTPDEVTVYDEYIGEGYGKITKECIAAIKLVAQTEGFFLDPVYTGKAMAGLIDLIRKGRFTAKDTVVFIHTGGIPYLFVYPKAFNG